MHYFVNNLGVLYLGDQMITETAIRNRFLACLREVMKTDTQVAIAGALGVKPPHIAKLRVAKSTKLPAQFIAKFCEVYHYSPYYILMGHGEKKAGSPMSKEEAKELAQAKVIETLLNALVSRGKLDEATIRYARKAIAGKI